jgi:hypothetical protein
MTIKKTLREIFSGNNGRLSVKRILGAMLCIPFVSSLYFDVVKIEKMEALGFLIALFITGTVIEKFSKHAEGVKTEKDE